MLEERLDGCAVDEELQREHVVDEHLEAAHTAAAILHARAVDCHDLRRAVVREDRLLESVGQRQRDLLCLAQCDIHEDLRAVEQAREDLALHVGVDVDGRTLDAQGLDLCGRAREDVPLAQGQHARQRQAVHPALLTRRVLGILVGHAHPAEQDVAAFMLDDLRCVEVEAVVELLEFRVLHHVHAVERQVACDVAGLVDVLAVELARLESLRAEDQRIVAAEVQHVRALPHVAEVLKARLELAEILPALFRLLVDEDRAAQLLLVSLCADDEVALAVAMEEIRIAEVARDALGAVRHDDRALLDMAVLLQRAEALRRRAHAVILGVAGVEDVDLALLREAAARVAAVLVVLVARPERELRHRVVDEVARPDMRPALVLVLAAKRIPLVEDMVFAIRERQAIRVVDEAERHLEMEAVVPAVRQREASRHLSVDGLLIKLFH